MPHKCVKCSATFADGSNELLQGCTSCGGRFFLYIKKENLAFAEEVTKQLSAEQKAQMEQEALELIGEVEDDTPVILDLESVRMSEQGKFELDLTKIFNKEPLVYKLEEGKYIIDVAATFQHEREKKK